MLAVKWFTKCNREFRGGCQTDFKYPVGKWLHEDKIEHCESGFHLPQSIKGIETWGHGIDGAVPCLVEIKGKILLDSGCDDHKMVVSDLKLIKELPFIREGYTKREAIRNLEKYIKATYPDMFYYDRGWKKKHIKNIDYSIGELI